MTNMFLITKEKILIFLRPISHFINNKCVLNKYYFINTISLKILTK